MHSGSIASTPALLLSAGEKVRRVLDILRHTDRLERVVHALADLLARHAQILGRECDVLFDDVCNDLVIRVLEHHAHAPADLKQEFFVARVHALDVDLAAAWQQDCVEGLGKRRFAATVVPQHHDEAAALDLYIHAAQRARIALPLRAGIGKGEVLCFYHFHIGAFPFVYSLNQRPVAPQGSASPVSATGRPSSSHVTLPPYFSATSRCSM